MLETPLIKYAAVWRAVAAADLRAACARALANFCAQSGRIRSVVITPGEFAEMEVVLRLNVVDGASKDPFPAPENDEREDDDDMAEVALASGWDDG